MIFIVKARTLHFLNFFLFTSLVNAHAGSIEGTVKEIKDQHIEHYPGDAAEPTITVLQV